MVLTFSGGVGGAAVHAPARCPRCFAVCPGAVFDAPPTDANARPRKWPRKVPPFAPLSAALLTLWVWFACLWGVCGVWWPAPAPGWCQGQDPGPRIGRALCGVALVRFAGGHCLPGGVIECSRCLPVPACPVWHGGWVPPTQIDVTRAACYGGARCLAGAGLARAVPGALQVLALPVRCLVASASGWVIPVQPVKGANIAPFTDLQRVTPVQPMRCLVAFARC
jgi:hypothetical protein